MPRFPHPVHHHHRCRWDTLTACRFVRGYCQLSSVLQQLHAAGRGMACSRHAAATPTTVRSPPRSTPRCSNSVHLTRAPPPCLTPDPPPVPQPAPRLNCRSLTLQLIPAYLRVDHYAASWLYCVYGLVCGTSLWFPATPGNNAAPAGCSAVRALTRFCTVLCCNNGTFGSNGHVKPSGLLSSPLPVGWVQDCRRLAVPLYG